MILGQWNLINIIETKKDKIIYKVVPIIEDDISDSLKNELLNNEWVMKVITNDDTEVNIINNLLLYNNPFCIKMPIDYTFRSRISNTKSWYTMELYESNIKQKFNYAKNKIKLLISNIIDFLEWLHIKEEKVHGDIKPDNILFKQCNKRPFCLIDYENIGEIEQNICYKNLPNGYYYYALGCESDKPYMSYRMDLQAFGFILWSLSLSIETYYSFPWQNQAFTYYNNKKTTNDFNNLNKIRDLNNLPKNELITSYFKIISEVGWYDNVVDSEIYNKIRKII